MFCQNCGQQNAEGAGFCSNCGGRSDGSYSPPAPGAMPTFVPPSPSTPGNGLSTVGIILGALAFIILPIVFGPAGLICGAIAKSKGESRAVVAMAVSGAGLVVGMILGALVFASM